MQRATKLVPPRPRGVTYGWASGHSEYEIEGETNRFRYIMEPGWSRDNPGSGPNGERRLVAVVGARAATHPRGPSDGQAMLFEELANRPLSDRTIRLNDRLYTPQGVLIGPV